MPAKSCVAARASDCRLSKGEQRLFMVPFLAVDNAAFLKPMPEIIRILLLYVGSGFMCRVSFAVSELQGARVSSKPTSRGFRCFWRQAVANFVFLSAKSHKEGSQWAR